MTIQAGSWRKLWVTLSLVCMVVLSGLRASAEDVTISWVIRPHLDGGESYRRVVAEYEARNPGVKVDLVMIVPSDNDFDSFVDARFGSGQIPNIWYPGGSRGPRFYSTKGMLLDLTPYISQSSIDMSDFYEPLVDFVTSEEHGITALPLGISPFTMMYNPDLFDAAGLAHPPADWNDRSWTWERFLEVARRLTVDVDGDGLPERYGHDFWSPALQNTPMLFGGDWFDDVGYKTGFPERSRAADPETVEALEFLADAVHTYKVMPTSADVSRLGGSLFANGKAAMFYGNNHNFRGLIDAGLRFGVTAVPRPSADAPPRTIAFPDAYAMFAGQANADAAFDFLEYLFSYEGAKLTFPALLSPRPRRSQADIWIDFARETLGLGERDIAAFLGSLDYVRMSPSFSIVDWGRYNQLINPSVQRILQGIAPAQTELEDLDRRLNSLIKEALGH